MFYICEVDKVNKTCVVCDTCDDVKETYSFKDVIDIIKKNKVKVVGVTKGSKGYSFNVFEDSPLDILRDYLGKAYKGDFEISYDSYKEIVVSDWGDWVVPLGQEEDIEEIIANEAEARFLEEGTEEYDEFVEYMMDSYEFDESKALDDDWAYKLQKIIDKIYNKYGLHFYYEVEDDCELRFFYD